MVSRGPSLRLRVLAAAAAAGFATLDVAMTLAGQPPDYHAGRYESADEGNPLARPFLAAGPDAFVGLLAVWVVGIAAVVIGWRAAWAVRLAAGIVASHAFGAGCWMAFRGLGGPLAAAGTLAVAAVVARTLWKRSRPRG